MEKQIKEILPDIFYSYIKRYPHIQVFNASDNHTIDHNLLDKTYVNTVLENDSLLIYNGFYYTRKSSGTSVRKIHAISLDSHIRIGYKILSYFLRTQEGSLIKDASAGLDKIQISKAVLASKKRYYGLTENANRIYHIRDIKKFFFKSSLNLYNNYLPTDEDGVWEETRSLYNKLYEIAGEDFGLLQNSWHSWLLADSFLQCIDKTLANNGLKFFRDGDAYFFDSKSVSSAQLELTAQILKNFMMSFNMDKTGGFAFCFKKHRYKYEAFFADLLLAFFPLFGNNSAMRNYFRRILYDAFPDNICKQKFFCRILNSKQLDSIKIYHTLRWAMKAKLDARFYYKELQNQYDKAPWYLRSQIRLLFLSNNNTSILNKLFENHVHEPFEKVDFNSLCDKMNLSKYKVC